MPLPRRGRPAGEPGRARAAPAAVRGGGIVAEAPEVRSGAVRGAGGRWPPRAAAVAGAGPPGEPLTGAPAASAGRAGAAASDPPPGPVAGGPPGPGAGGPPGRRGAGRRRGPRGAVAGAGGATVAVLPPADDGAPPPGPPGTSAVAASRAPAAVAAATAAAGTLAGAPGQRAGLSGAEAGTPGTGATPGRTAPPAPLPAATAAAAAAAARPGTATPSPPAARRSSAAATARASSSAARSGARPAHSRSRLTSRACAKYRSDSTPRPNTAAMPAYEPYCWALSWSERAAASAVMKGSMLGNGPYGGRLTRVGGHRLAGRQRAHAGGESGGVALEHEEGDLVEHRVGRGRVQPIALGQHDLLGGGRLLELEGGEQVLVQLLPRTPSHLLDRDVDVRPQTRQLDHVARELPDRHGLAHLEHEDLAALAERPRADDELHRLRDRHEVAGHPLVGERDGAAERDLAAEDRHDRARRAEHVAEADRRELRVRPPLGRRLDGVLGERLRGAHHRRRLHRLVGRDQHDPPAARLAGDARHEPGRERVVAHGLDRVELHERDVLVRGRVEDDRRAVLREDLPHALALLAVGEHRREHGGMDVAVVLELALDAEQVLLGVVDEHEPSRRHARDLAAELGADRPARTGDEHDLVG